VIELTISSKKFILTFSHRGEWLGLNRFTEQPSNIRWHNMPYSSCGRCTRKVFSVLLALIIILASFGVVIGAKLFQEQFKEKMSSDIDCNYLKIDNAGLYQEYFDDVLTEIKRVKTYCYCFQQFKELGLGVYSVSISFNGKSFIPCNDWLNLYVQSESLRYGVIVLIPLVNFILSIFLECIFTHNS
jgi:hypothetical protein